MFVGSGKAARLMGKVEGIWGVESMHMYLDAAGSVHMYVQCNVP